jgi:hypothetical protein
MLDAIKEIRAEAVELSGAEDRNPAKPGGPKRRKRPAGSPRAASGAKRALRTSKHRAQTAD